MTEQVEAEVTESQTEADENEQDEATELPPIGEAFDGAAELLVGKLEELTEDANAPAKWLKANSRDTISVMDDLKADDTDKEVQEALEAIESLKSRALALETELDKSLKNRAETVIRESQDEQAVVQHREAFKEADRKVRDFTRTLISTYGDEIKPYLPARVKLTKAAKPSDGDGIRRLRHFTVSVDGTVAKTKVGQEYKSTFGAAAQRMNAPLQNVMDEYFKVIGSTNKDDFKSTTFTYTHPESGQTFEVEAEYAPPAE